MSQRSFGIPVLQALAIATTQAACGDPMIGSWDMNRYVYDGDVFELPVVYDFGSYSQTTTGSITINKEGTGTFDFTTIYSNDEEGYSYTSSVSATRIGKGVWDVLLPELYNLSMSCTATRETLTCAGSDEDDTAIAMDFDRAP